MTFKKFEEIFLNEYPDGHVVMHGKFGGTEKNKKVTITFNSNGKVYSYYGAYEDILNKVGIPVISKQRFAEVEQRLNTFKERHGTPKLGMFSKKNNEVYDYSEEIKEYEMILDNYRNNYIIV